MMAVRAAIFALLLCVAAPLTGAPAAVSAPAAWPSPRVDTRSEVSRILRAPQFQSASDAIAQPAETWWERMWEFIGKIIERVFGKAARSLSPERLSLIGNLALALMLGVAALCLARFVSLFLTHPPRGIAPPGQTPLAVRESAAELSRRAETFARGGDFRAALAWLFRASVVLLEERFNVRIAESATPLECRRVVARGVPGAVTHFEVIVRGFVAAIYSRATLGENDWHAAKRAYAALGIAVQ